MNTLTATRASDSADDAVVLRRDSDGNPSLTSSVENADLITALYYGGVPSVASSGGHAGRLGNILLADGRELFVAADLDDANFVDRVLSLFDDGIEKKVQKFADGYSDDSGIKFNETDRRIIVKAINSFISEVVVAGYENPNVDALDLLTSEGVEQVTDIARNNAEEPPVPTRKTVLARMPLPESQSTILYTLYTQGYPNGDENGNSLNALLRRKYVTTNEKGFPELTERGTELVRGAINGTLEEAATQKAPPKEVSWATLTPSQRRGLTEIAEAEGTVPHYMIHPRTGASLREAGLVDHNYGVGYTINERGREVYESR